MEDRGGTKTRENDGPVPRERHALNGAAIEALSEKSPTRDTLVVAPPGRVAIPSTAGWGAGERGAHDRSGNPVLDRRDA